MKPAGRRPGLRALLAATALMLLASVTPRPAVAQEGVPAGPPASAPAPVPAEAPSAPARNGSPEDAADTSADREAARAARRAARQLRNRELPADWQLAVKAPGPLRELLERYLDVARFRSAAAQDRITVSELSRLVAAAPEQARGLLRTEGYYDAKVQARLELPGTGPPVVHLAVQPGARAQVGRLTFDVQGELADRALDDQPDARELRQALEREWRLPEGADFTQDAWNGAKSSLMTRLRADAYPSAAWVGTAAQVDPQTHRVRIFVVADSGPRYRFGDLRIEGIDRYDDAVVRNLSPFGTGQPYSEKALLDFQEKLASAGLFESASVTIEPDPAQADAVPVLVRLRERQAQQATLGVGVSSDSGPRISLEHVHRRPFGFNWTATSKLELARDNRRLQFDLMSHPKTRDYRNLISGMTSREEAAGLIVRETQARIGRTQDTERIERLYYLELLDSSTQSVGTTRSVGAVSGNYEWSWRRLDSLLQPTRGLTASARVGLGHSFGVSGDPGRSAGPFTRASGRVTGYRPFAGHWFSTGRIELGQVFARDSVAVPYPLLFRAGGDNSVRGYGYQELGPDDEDGISVGGRVLGTASLEVARPFSLQRPEFLGALFVDAGDAARDWQDFSPSVGVGVGARWRSPVGPLSLDLAYGLEARRFRVHFNVGIAF